MHSKPSRKTMFKEFHHSSNSKPERRKTQSLLTTLHLSEITEACARSASVSGTSIPLKGSQNWLCGTPSPCKYSLHSNLGSVSDFLKASGDDSNWRQRLHTSRNLHLLESGIFGKTIISSTTLGSSLHNLEYIVPYSQSDRVRSDTAPNRSPSLMHSV